MKRRKSFLSSFLSKKHPPQESAEHDDLLRVAHDVGDIFKHAPYYDIAEAHMDQQWDQMLWPMIQGLDFRYVVDLAAGHGRNSAKLRLYADELLIVDINQECINFCKKRFAGDPKINYLKTDGVSLLGVKEDQVTLIYSFDSMVHFDSDVIKEYLKDFYRVLKPGGACFCHHSNFVGNPGGNFMESPHLRNFMSKELFAHYASKAGLKVLNQKVIDWPSYPNLDCLSLLQKPT